MRSGNQVVEVGGNPIHFLRAWLVYQMSLIGVGWMDSLPERMTKNQRFKYVVDLFNKMGRGVQK